MQRGWKKWVNNDGKTQYSRLMNLPRFHLCSTQAYGWKFHYKTINSILEKPYWRIQDWKFFPLHSRNGKQWHIIGKLGVSFSNISQFFNKSMGFLIVKIKIFPLNPNMLQINLLVKPRDLFNLSSNLPKKVKYWPF